MDMTDVMLQKLQSHFGFNQFLNGQAEVINLLLNKEPAVAIFPTGGGKSLCYQLPALMMEHLTLVVSPLLSLMKDQIDFLKEKNIPAAKLDSTMPREEYNAIIRSAVKGELKILMISVERFRNERFRTHLKDMKISLLVVDEAHCISEWGHNFRPEYLKIPTYQKEFKITQTLLLTATATPAVIDDMCVKFGIPKQNVVITGFYRPNLHLQVSPCSHKKKDESLLKRLSRNPNAPSIVYVTLQKTAEEVASMLSVNNIRAAHYHAGMKSEEREKVQNDFMDGQIAVVVATIAFGMGIDKRDIRRVIHYNLPKSLENYCQEIGRAGRDGEKSLCEVLADRDNLNILENFVYGDTPEKNAIEYILNSIRNCSSSTWEVKLHQLSYDSDFRLLPLKTFLVYLELKNIIKPVYTYFETYYFKLLREKEKIIGTFKGERQQLVKAMFDYSETKKIYTYMDIDNLLKNYSVDRARVIKALEYFEEQGWIELKSGNSIDVYEVLTKNFDTGILTEVLYDVFKQKEKSEITRIRDVLVMFESEKCLSYNLADHFGEIITGRCGHCSVCESGKAIIAPVSELPSLSSLNFREIISGLLNACRKSGNDLTVPRAVKFLCGINTPKFYSMKGSHLPGYGRLQDYPYAVVEKWVEENLEM